MDQSAYPPHDLPDVFLLLGTDAAGKDYVANILAKMIHEGGGIVQKRRGFFSANSSRMKDSTKKSFFDYAQERLFLALYVPLAPLMPMFLHGLMLFDMARYRQPESKLIVIGHHGLRALAFHLARNEKTASSFLLPAYLRKTIGLMRKKTRAHVIVIDVNESIRQRRISDRVAAGREDFLDIYMVLNRARADRIEGSLVRVATELMGGAKLTNDDLPEKDIRSFLSNSFRCSLKATEPTV